MHTKHEWRKKEKAIYLPKNKPELVDVPTFKFIVIRGEGNPNSDFFSECIGVLYSLAYVIKMNLKKTDTTPDGYNDWTVYPLEGVWDISEKGRNNYTGKLDKDELVFDLMLRQPNFVDETFFSEMLEMTKRKKAHQLLDRVKFKSIKEGRCIQMMHIGSYDDEPASFKLMEEFASNEGLVRKSKVHREIYLSDFRKVPIEKLKTALRFQLKN